MRHAALITARGNNQSLPDKNLIAIAGKPSLQYAIEAAQGAAGIVEVWLSTEDPRIRDLGETLGCRIIDRPTALAHPDSNHGDVIRHGVERMRESIDDLGCVTVLLGNTVMTTSGLIDLSLRILDRRPEFDSVMSVWQAQDDHPYRALRMEPDGTLRSFLGIESGTARQSYPPVFFYDQGVWTFRQACVDARRGPNPWWWMGEKSFGIIREWVAGRDFHSQLDIEVSEWWVRSGRQDNILNFQEIRELI